MMSRRLAEFVWVVALLIAPVALAQSLPDDHPLQDWLTRLASPEPRVQRSAAYSLKSIGPDPQQSAAALIEALKSANPYVRRHAAMAIGEFHVAPEATAPALIEILVDPDPTVREHATAALAKLGLAAFPAINKALNSDDSAPSKSKRDPVPLVADYAAAALTEMGPEVIPLLIAESREGFDDPLLYVLQQQSAAATAELTKYLRSARADDRRWAAQTLAAVGPAGTAASLALIPLLHDTSLDVRSAATETLGSFGRSAAGPAAAAVAQNLTSNNGDLVKDSLEALRVFGPLTKEACRSIAAQLDRPRPADRYKVIETLAAACRGDVNVTRALTRSLRDPDAAVRSAAMTALGKMGPPAAAILARHLRDADPTARAAAARGLAIMGPDAVPAVPALALTLQDSDRNVKAAAADALSAIGPGAAAAAPVVVKSLERTDFGDPAVLVDILGHIGAARPEVAPTLVQIILSKGDTEIAGRAANALTHIGAAAVPALIEALNGPADASCPAVKVVRAIGPAAAPSAPSLVRLLSDRNHTLCPAVLPALAAILGDQALPDLTRAVNDPDSKVRKEAIGAIGGLKAGFDQLAPVLLPALSDPDASVRVEAIHALARFDAARPALEKARLDPDQTVQRAAMQATPSPNVAQGTGPQVSDWVTQLHDPDQDQRIEAAEMLLDLGPLAAPAIPQLIAALDDPNETVAALAARALLDLGHDAGELGPVQRALINDDEISSRIAASVYDIQVLNGEISKPGRKARPPRSEPENESETPLPPIPWPMPGASEWDVIDDKLLGPPTATLNEIHETLRRALDETGFNPAELFAAPGGFALITKMERIHDDGTSYTGIERWTQGKIPLHSLSLRDYLTSLFFDAPGEFRVFVFVISTMQPFPPENPSKEQEDKARDLELLQGGRVLPSSVAGLPWKGRHGYVLLYRFERKLGEPAAEVRPEPLPLRTHLEKAGMHMLVP
jgi:HEAT repeat protein